MGTIELAEKTASEILEDIRKTRLELKRLQDLYVELTMGVKNG